MNEGKIICPPSPSPAPCSSNSVLSSFPCSSRNQGSDVALAPGPKSSLSSAVLRETDNVTLHHPDKRGQRGLLRAFLWHWEEQMEPQGRGPDKGRSRLPESLFLSRTLQNPWKIRLWSEVRSKPRTPRQAQTDWALAQTPALQPTYCVTTPWEHALVPQIHMNKTRRTRAHCKLHCDGHSCVLVQAKGLSCPEPGQCSSLAPVSKLSKSYPEMQAGCPGERE